MAIAFDAATYLGSVVSNGTFGNTHTATGSNLIVFVGVANTYSGTKGNVTGVTYGGTAMNRIRDEVFLGGVGQSSLFWLESPSTGAQSIAVTVANGSTTYAVAASYTGCYSVNSSSQPDNSGANTGAATSLSTSITTIADNCWVAIFDANAVGNPSAGASTTQRVSNANGFGWFDSNSAKTPAGSVTLTSTIGAGANHQHIIVSFQPPVAGGTTYDALFFGGN